MPASKTTSSINVQGPSTPRFTTLRSHMAPLPIENIDTDQIVPARFLKTTSREGLGTALFAEWRGNRGAEADGAAPFVLDDPRYADAQVLVAGDNFGCGSSREHAPWALLDHGIRAVISTRFADIFRSNALKNGLLPVQVEAAILERLTAAAGGEAGAEITIKLEEQILISPWGEEIPFEVDAFARHCLLQGVDALGYLLARREAITAFERKHPTPWDTRTIAEDSQASGGGAQS